MALEKASIWGQVVGHKKTIEKLTSWLSSGRLPHAFLFVGPSGQGKKKVALGFAQSLLCENAPQACGVCSACRRVASGHSEGLILLEPEKGQIKIESARQVVKQLSLATWGGARVVIVNDANLLNPQAANALLKSIEEPPSQTYFILISQSQESVLTTIRSRSQVVRFGELSREELANLQRETFSQEAVTSAIDLWRELFAAKSTGFANLRELIDEREKARAQSQLWVEFLHDAWFVKKQLHGLTHPQLAQELALAAQLPEPVLSEISQRLMQLDRDIQQNCDYLLAFENFYYQTRQLVGLAV